MIEKPLVSIIVPCYNVEKFVEESINSVILQDYKNWECILVDDGSKDKTLEIIKNFENLDKRIRVFTQKNSGPSAARNTGIISATGKFLFFLDSDDVLTTDALTTLVSADSNNDIITGATMSFIISNGKTNEVSLLYAPKERNITFKNDNSEVLKRAMEGGLTPVPHNKLYRKDFIDKYNLRFKAGILHEDELWFFETMLFARNVKFISEVTYFYRIDNLDAITKNMGDKNLKSYIRVLEEIIEQYSYHEKYSAIARWYAVYIKKIVLDFAIRDRQKLSDDVIYSLEIALKKHYIPLGKNNFLSKKNNLYYKTINKLSLKDFSVIQKYFFWNPVNSLRKIVRVFKISYFLN